MDDITPEEAIAQLEAELKLLKSRPRAQMPNMVGPFGRYKTKAAGIRAVQNRIRCWKTIQKERQANHGTTEEIKEELEA